ncbi:MAG: hypothetical protein J6L24_01595 [Oscillospiraceae bacterium]|nr:hypothetical protein [Oscillospiraceae bacterium]
MEPIYRQTYHIQDCDVDCFGRLKPSMILFYAQDVAGQHCNMLSLDYDTLASRRLFWAVIRHRVQVARMPQRGESITVETWPMPTTRVAYPRSMVAYDTQGNEVFRSISLWVLMDLDTRAMILPGKSGVDVTGLLRGSELAVPPSLTPRTLNHGSSRTVAFTDLDRNGHMNNCRYLDWVADLLPGAFHKEHQVKEFIVCYLSEAREGQNMELHWELNEDGSLRVDANRPDGNSSAGHSRVFSAQMLY